jgi:hypothetical protein
MVIEKKFFPHILRENEKTYFAHLEGILSSVDELCSLQITYTGDKYIFRLAPSHPKYINNIVESLIQFHNLISIRLDFSKSMKTTAIILFKLNLSS